MLKHILIFALLCAGAYYYWTTRPVTHGPGVIAPKPPVQKTAYNTETMNYKGISITPQKKIAFEARVLAIKSYYFDKYSKLAPIDIVFGWGPMSDEANLNSLMVRQSERSFYWEMTEPPIKKQDMWRHAANMHLIGSTQAISDKINAIRKGQIVQIEGYLVNAKSPEGWTLKSSLSRDDIGKGSSELVWINSITIR